MEKRQNADLPSGGICPNPDPSNESSSASCEPARSKMTQMAQDCFLPLSCMITIDPHIAAGRWSYLVVSVDKVWRFERVQVMRRT